MSEQPGALPAKQSEIEAHVKAYSDWWKRFDDIEAGKVSFPDEASRELAQAEADRNWLAEDRWLWEHGVIADEVLHYDRETKTFSLPPNAAVPGRGD